MRNVFVPAALSLLATSALLFASGCDPRPTVVCGDNICEGAETATNCAADCGGNIVCGDGTCDASETATSCPLDCGTCGNGTCEASENSSVCPADCGAAMCGDGLCDVGEDETSCAADCFGGCGNGSCDPGESAAVCPSDCTGAVCGNGTCEGSETLNTCPADCGGPTCGDGTCGTGENPTNCPADCMVSVNCGNGAIDGSEECDGADLGGASCANAASATHSALTGGGLGCYASGTIAADGSDVSCSFDFSGCTGPDLMVYANGLDDGYYVETGANPSSCEVSLGCAGGTSNRDLLHFPFVTENVGNLAFDVGSPTNNNPPYMGLWENNGCAGNEWPDYARYWIEDSGGSVVATGLKGSFCNIENFGNAPDYSGPACSPSHNCGNMGMNVGCADDYYIGLSCQFVDITGIAGGTYTLCAEVDYNNKVAELDDHNNIGCVSIVIP